MSRVGQLDEDMLECGNAQETWQEFVHHLAFRAAQARDIARQLERDAADATARAAEHREDAEGFEALANAMRNAPVTFAKVEKRAASVDTDPKGEDPTKIGAEFIGSAVPHEDAADAHTPPPSDQGE